MATSLAKANVFGSDVLTIADELDALVGDGPSRVQQAMRDAVLGPGQRLRPLLSLRVARVLDVPENKVLRAAAAVELLHCASLIIDDLPCMDNDNLRRNRPAAHIEFGEATAILAAFGLVAKAARAVIDFPDFQSALLSTLDCDGLIGGQELDLAARGALDDCDRVVVASMKTVPLFELAARAGSLGAPLERSRTAVRFGREFGAAYQIVDDYLDGEAVTPHAIEEQFRRASAVLPRLGYRGYALDELLGYLRDKVGNEDSCRYR